MDSLTRTVEQVIQKQPGAQIRPRCCVRVVVVIKQMYFIACVRLVDVEKRLDYLFSR